MHLSRYRRAKSESNASTSSSNTSNSHCKSKPTSISNSNSSTSVSTPKRIAIVHKNQQQHIVEQSRNNKKCGISFIDDEEFNFFPILYLFYLLFFCAFILTLFVSHSITFYENYNHANLATLAVTLTMTNSEGRQLIFITNNIIHDNLVEVHKNLIQWKWKEYSSENLLLFYFVFVLFLCQTFFNFYRYLSTKDCIHKCAAASATHIFTRFLLYFVFVFVVLYVLQMHLIFWLFPITLLFYFGFNFYCILSFATIVIRHSMLSSLRLKKNNNPKKKKKTTDPRTELNASHSLQLDAHQQQYQHQQESEEDEMLSSIYSIRRISIVSNLCSCFTLLLVSVYRNDSGSLLDILCVLWTISVFCLTLIFIRNRTLVSKFIRVFIDRVCVCRVCLCLCACNHKHNHKHKHKENEMVAHHRRQQLFVQRKRRRERKQQQQQQQQQRVRTRSGCDSSHHSHQNFVIDIPSIAGQTNDNGNTSVTAIAVAVGVGAEEEDDAVTMATTEDILHLPPSDCGTQTPETPATTIDCSPDSLEMNDDCPQDIFLVFQPYSNSQRSQQSDETDDNTDIMDIEVQEAKHTDRDTDVDSDENHDNDNNNYNEKNRNRMENIVGDGAVSPFVASDAYVSQLRLQQRLQTQSCLGILHEMDDDADADSHNVNDEDSGALGESNQNQDRIRGRDSDEKTEMDHHNITRAAAMSSMTERTAKTRKSPFFGDYSEHRHTHTRGQKKPNSAPARLRSALFSGRREIVALAKQDSILNEIRFDDHQQIAFAADVNTLFTTTTNAGGGELVGIPDFTDGENEQNSGDVAMEAEAEAEAATQTNTSSSTMVSLSSMMMISSSLNSQSPSSTMPDMNGRPKLRHMSSLSTNDIWKVLGVSGF